MGNESSSAREHGLGADEENGLAPSHGKWALGESGYSPSGKSIRTHPDDGFPCSNRAGAPNSEGKDRKKLAIGASIRRLVSGKAKRGIFGERRSSLPTSLHDLTRDEEGTQGAAGGGNNKMKGRKGRTRNSDALKGSPSAPSKDAIKEMGRYLGIDMDSKEGKTFKWIAEEALTAALPSGWEEHRTEDNVSYFYDTASGESIWEHPLDAYYRFLFAKMRKLRKANKGLPNRDSEAQKAKDRELIDLLWAMEQEQKNGQGVSTSDTSTFESSSQPGSLSETPSFYSSSNDSPTSSRIGTPVLDPESVPDDVRELAANVGLNLQALSTPVSVEEVTEMAEYLGVDVMREGYLLHVVKMALQAPLPKGWDIYKDDKGDPFYFHRKSGRSSYRHPADDYFINKVLEDRARHVKAVQEGSAVKASEPWLDLTDAKQGRYWYNFRTKERTCVKPSLMSVLSGGGGTPLAQTPRSDTCALAGSSHTVRHTAALTANAIP